MGPFFEGREFLPTRLSHHLRFLSEGQTGSTGGEAGKRPRDQALAFHREIPTRGTLCPLGCDAICIRLSVEDEAKWWGREWARLNTKNMVMFEAHPDLVECIECCNEENVLQ
eukprot:scaffold48_cov394-Pavlova_lutheri.AAC.1